MKKIKLLFLVGLFSIYCLVMIYLLFLSRPLRLDHSIGDFFQHNSNFVPFKTIMEYIERYKNGFRTASFINLAGNLFAFFPMGIFLPCLFKSMRRFGRFFLSISGMVVLVEITQLFLRAGVIDIDDVIFNVFGAVVGYTFVVLPLACKHFKKTNSHS